MTAVTRPAEARRRASRMMNSSIRCSLTGGEVGWMTNTSCPRIESSILTLISPSGKWRRRGSVSWTSRISAMRAARAGLAPPEMSFSSPQGELSAPVNSTAVCNLPINRLSPDHPSGNTHGCRAVRDVLGHYRTRPSARFLAKFDRRDQHRVDADEGAVADLGPVLVRAVEIGGNRTRADVGVGTQVGVPEVGDVRHPRAARDPGPHQLGEAPDVHVLGDLGAGPQLGERATVGAVADPRVLYIDVRADVALGADVGVALEHGERFDDRVFADHHVRVDERGRGVDDGDAAEHALLEKAAAQDVARLRQADAVLHPHRLLRVVELDHVDRLQVQEDVGQVELARLVVVGDLLELLHQAAAVEAVEADVELVHAGAQLGRGVLALDDLLQRAVGAADDAAVVATWVFDARYGRRRARLHVRVVDLEDAGGGEQGRVTVDHDHVAAAELARRDLPQGVGGAFRVALINDLGPAFEVRGDVRVVGVGDDRNVLGARLVHRREDPVDHGPPADWMEDFGNPRPHART